VRLWPIVVWVQRSDFSEGTIDIDVRGRDVLQRSFLGVAFHGKSDTAYECVYLPLRIVVKGQTVQVFVGMSRMPALEARKLGQLERGMIGLWTGNNSDGDFAHLRVTPTK
jgi:hypothetical protein